MALRESNADVIMLQIGKNDSGFVVLLSVRLYSVLPFTVSTKIRIEFNALTAEVNTLENFHRIFFQIKFHILQRSLIISEKAF